MAYNPSMGRNERTGSDNFDSLAIDTNNMSSQGVFAALPWMQSLWDDLTGYNAATRDYQWQQYLLDYNTPQNQMERMKAAGINPNLAAIGISGGNMQNPTGNTGASGQGAAALGSVAQAAQAAGSVATDFGMLKVNQDKVSVETRKTLMDLGFTELQSKGLEISLRYLDDKEKLQVATLVANLDNIKQDYNVKVQQVKQIEAQIREIDEQIELFKSQKDYTNQLKAESTKRTLQIEADTWYTNWINGIRQLYNIDPSLPVPNQFLMLAIQGDSNYEKFGDFVFDYSYKDALGKATADAEQSWNHIPTTPSAYAAYLANYTTNTIVSLAPKVADFFKNVGASLNDLRKNKPVYDEFKSCYDEAREDLEDSVKMAKRKYKRSRGMNNEERALLYNNWQSLQKELDEFTEEKFADKIRGN